MMKYPRKLKKKIFGTKRRPKYLVGLDRGQGKDITIEALVSYENGKVRIAEIWRKNCDQMQGL